jgi:hypothetical protein
VADGKGPVGCGLPDGQGGVAGDSSSRHVDDGAMGFGQWQGAPMGGGGLRVDLRQRNGKGRVRSGLIDDAVHERAELTG